MIDDTARDTLERLDMDQTSLVSLVASVSGEFTDQPCTLIPRLFVDPGTPVSIPVPGGQVKQISTSGVLSCFKGSATARTKHLSDEQDLFGLARAAICDLLRKENDDVMRVIRDSDWPLRLRGLGSWDHGFRGLDDVIEASNVIRYRANSSDVVGLATPGFIRAVSTHEVMGPLISQQHVASPSICWKVAMYFGLSDLRIIWGSLDLHPSKLGGFLWLGHMPQHDTPGSEALPSAMYKLIHKDHGWIVNAREDGGKLTIEVNHYVHFVEASGSLGCLFR